MLGQNGRLLAILYDLLVSGLCFLARLHLRLDVGYGLVFRQRRELDPYLRNGVIKVDRVMERDLFSLIAVI